MSSIGEEKHEVSIEENLQQSPKYMLFAFAEKLRTKLYSTCHSGNKAIVHLDKLRDSFSSR